VSAFAEPGRTALQVRSRASGTSTGSRSTPTSSWTSGSSRTRTGIRDLRPLTGHDPAVRDYVLERGLTLQFLDRLDDLLTGILPAYQAEGRSYLTVAIGCTGGRHRSVAVAEELARRFRDRGVAVRTSHRDVALGG
jgi:hypothetical protein